jgi:hypothetical protein
VRKLIHCRSSKPGGLAPQITLSAGSWRENTVFQLAIPPGSQPIVRYILAAAGLSGSGRPPGYLLMYLVAPALLFISFRGSCEASRLPLPHHGHQAGLAAAPTQSAQWSMGCVSFGGSAWIAVRVVLLGCQLTSRIPGPEPRRWSIVVVGTTTLEHRRGTAVVNATRTRANWRQMHHGHRLPRPRSSCHRWRCRVS